eukprot:scaffold17205_cov186-Amphora_coffeaeformis.AAC.19
MRNLARDIDGLSFEIDTTFCMWRCWRGGLITVLWSLRLSVTDEMASHGGRLVFRLTCLGSHLRVKKRSWQGKSSLCGTGEVA